jgi:hypothetical protein
MAFPAFHVTCCYAGSLVSRENTLALLGSIQWSEELTSGAASTNIAPPSRDTGDPVFYVLAAADSYAEIGATPTGAAKRIPVQAGVPLAIYAENGDKIAYVAA